MNSTKLVSFIILLITLFSCEFIDEDSCERNISGHFCITVDSEGNQADWQIEIIDNNSNELLDLFSIAGGNGKRECSEILLTTLEANRVVKMRYARGGPFNDWGTDTISFCSKREIILK